MIDQEKIALVDDTKNDAVIIEDVLDEESSYSHLYLTTVYHDDLVILERVLKTQFYKINHKGTTKLEEYLLLENKSFDDQFHALGLEDNASEEKALKREAYDKGDKSDLFFYALSVAVLSCFIQFSFIFALIREFMREDLLITTDTDLISIRVIAFMTITIKVWIELCNGKKILMQGIYHSYMFRSNGKRIISSIMGGFQIFTALACCFCSSGFVVRTENVKTCVKHFSEIIILTEIDNWIGDYFMNTNKEMEVYSNDNVKVISVFRRNESGRFIVANTIINFLLFATFILSIIPIYKSFTFVSNVI